MDRKQENKYRKTFHNIHIYFFISKLYTHPLSFEPTTSPSTYSMWWEMSFETKLIGHNMNEF